MCLPHYPTSRSYDSQGDVVGYGSGCWHANFCAVTSNALGMLPQITNEARATIEALVRQYVETVGPSLE